MPQFIVAVACGIIYGLSTGLGIPSILKFVYPIIFSETGDSHIALAKVLVLSLLPILVMALRGLSSFFNAYYVAYCGQHVLETIRMKVFAKIQELPLAFFHKR
ncbi:MAG TPA: ABC transporter transmembrane domain-containing protein, partial [Opitutales bacterium]|nr:ABC transporter transmembrane domain-containing protein [Opitutales bacterium]